MQSSWHSLCCRGTARPCRVGGCRTGAGAGAQTVELGWTGLLWRLSDTVPRTAAILVLQHWACWGEHPKLKHWWWDDVDKGKPQPTHSTACSVQYKQMQCRALHHLGGKLVVSLDEADQFIVFRLFYIKRSLEMKRTSAKYSLIELRVTRHNVCSDDYRLMISGSKNSCSQS